ncbi:ABC transporter ATP-binding protein [Entomobacter blattae]|uniref:Fe(3+) dicitrate transport ATP-binding protein FecE n=1 Tax=Entomobacter blattae TaxID=2762277 RepID=A0A7H1NRW2_9PROT|nr:ABC transporter ATP-binding protein [Entomobacter blattae]QNT78522.1 Fe(3+) dicitrate transport ATP-binding protein FecE [Entomobacter blattae]
MRFLRAENLDVGYHHVRVIHNLSLEPLPQGEVTSLLGPNGSGKSTLLRAIAGLEKIGKQGKVFVGEQDISRISVLERSKICVYLPQSLPPRIHMQVLETVVTARKIAASSPNAASYLDEVDEVLEILARLKIDDLALSYLDELSGGQRQLVGLAQALACRPHLLLLDEPLSALDMNRQFSVMDVIGEETIRRNMITVMVLHDLNIAMQKTDRVVMLQKGRIYAYGQPREVITPAALSDVYHVQARIEPCSKGLLHVMVDGVSEELS